MVIVTANVGLLGYDVVENRVTSQNLVFLFKSPGAGLSRVSAIVEHPRLNQPGENGGSNGLLFSSL